MGRTNYSLHLAALMLGLTVATAATAAARQAPQPTPQAAGHDFVQLGRHGQGVVGVSSCRADLGPGQGDDGS
jgi:hypothetical protein